MPPHLHSVQLIRFFIVAWAIDDPPRVPECSQANEDTYSRSTDTSACVLPYIITADYLSLSFIGNRDCSANSLEDITLHIHVRHKVISIDGCHLPLRWICFNRFARWTIKLFLWSDEMSPTIRLARCMGPACTIISSQ